MSQARCPRVKRSCSGASGQRTPYYPNIRQRSDVLNRWNFLKTGFYEGINVVGIPPSMTRPTPPPAPSDSLLRGVSAAGLPWTVAEGEVELDGSGELKVEVTGLVFSAGPFAGTTGPVTAVRASLTCEGVSGPVAITSPVPLSPEGDAEIEETITLPPTCVGPIVLVNLAALTGGPLPAPGFWIAATGF